MQENAESTRSRWLMQCILIIFAVYFYVFMEWLFFVTKPSFMTVLSTFDRFTILLASTAPLLLGGIAVTILLWIPAKVIKNRMVRIICMTFVRLIAAAFLAVTLFLLVDNFTYTLFSFGVRTSGGIAVTVYGLLLAALLYVSFRFIVRMERALNRSVAYRALACIAVILVVLSGIAAVGTSRSRGSSDVSGTMDAASLENRPFIFLISTDALNATHMSFYGYHRTTTPFLDSMKDRALVCENCFPNAGTSGASLASMLTGKLPTETKLIYPPEILKGRDAYQHLPGVLRSFGYRNIDISIRRHADPEDLNLRNSFHWANFRELQDTKETVDVVLFLGQEPSYFLHTMGERIMDRFLHVIGRKIMEDPLGEVIRPVGRRYSKDGERIKSFYRHLQRANSPLFVHMHLLGTHGPIYDSGLRLFSQGKRQSELWETDFYDDAILTFDNYIKSIVQTLRKKRLLNRSVIVLFSDHGQNFTVEDRLPLIFFFPNGEHSGRIQENVQNLDIAPTILDYMGISQPSWMRGQSLISTEIEPDRLIFSADPKHRIISDGKGGRKTKERNESVPPFYQLIAMGVHCCHKYYALDLGESVLTVSNTVGHTAPCPEGDLPDAEEIGRLIIDHLAGHGYDTSSIQTPLKIRNIQ